MDVPEFIALSKQKQKKVEKKAQKVKGKLKTETMQLKNKRLHKKRGPSTKGLIYIGHIPHGFYENEMMQYFRQFGKVLNVKLCRSKRTGKSKGYAFVEFLHDEVAKIAAETMNNYIMFKRRLVVEYIPEDKRKRINWKSQITENNTPTQRRREIYLNLKNDNIGIKKHLQDTSRRKNKLEKSLKRINKLGINYSLQPMDVPTASKGSSLKSAKGA